MRYAVYFTPARTDPLSRKAAEWLGRDAFDGSTTQSPADTGLAPAEVAFHTAAARRYGFHATMKAPFRLADDQTETALERALDAFCGQAAPFAVPRMALRQIDGFFALVPAERSVDLDRLAGDVVAAFEQFRAPLSDAEIERRNPDALTAAQFRNLCQWGYPYVFEEFRFHMTLSGRVAGAEAERVRAAIETCLGSLIDRPLAVDGLALFVEPEPGAPFSIRRRAALGRGIERKSA